jgi:hypothetical protein
MFKFLEGEPFNIEPQITTRELFCMIFKYRKEFNNIYLNLLDGKPLDGWKPRREQKLRLCSARNDFETFRKMVFEKGFDGIWKSHMFGSSSKYFYDFCTHKNIEAMNFIKSDWRELVRIHPSEFVEAAVKSNDVDWIVEIMNLCGHDISYNSSDLVTLSKVIVRTLTRFQLLEEARLFMIKMFKMDERKVLWMCIQHDMKKLYHYIEKINDKCFCNSFRGTANTLDDLKDQRIFNMRLEEFKEECQVMTQNRERNERPENKANERKRKLNDNENE